MAAAGALETWPAQVAAPRHNIYLTILDSYCSPESMRKVYGFDPRDFTPGLEGLGFRTVPDAASNYPFTALSVASTFSMEYLREAAGQGAPLNAKGDRAPPGR